MSAMIGQTNSHLPWTDDGLLGSNAWLGHNSSKSDPVSTWTVIPFGRSRWRGGRFACYAPPVMPKDRAFNCDFRFSPDSSKSRKINRLQTENYSISIAIRLAVRR